MSTIQNLRHELTHAWDVLLDGWQRLYHRAAGAITRFTQGHEAGDEADSPRERAERSTGWGLLTAEVLDGDDRIVVRLETPGMRKEDFDLEVSDQTLTVRGEKRLTQEEARGRWHITECAYGRFERVIPLPADVSGEDAGASYADGVLRVELPKRHPHQRGVKVQVG